MVLLKYPEMGYNACALEDIQSLKKFIAVLLVGIFLFLLSACSADNNDKVRDTTSEVSTENVEKTTVISSTDESDELITESEYLADNANLFNDKEKDKIIRKLNDVIKDSSFDIVIHTTNTFDGKIVDDYAVDYYKDKHYSADGCILVLNMDSREWHMEAFGLGKDLIGSEEQVDDISSQFLSELKENKYCDAMLIFIEQIGMLVKPAEKTTSNNDNSETENIEHFNTTTENHTPKISTLQSDTWYQHDSYPYLKYYNAEIDSITPGNNNCAVLYFPVCANCHYVSEMCGWNAPEFGYPINKSYHCKKCGVYTLVSLRLEYY